MLVQNALFAQNCYHIGVWCVCVCARSLAENRQSPPLVLLMMRQMYTHAHRSHRKWMRRVSETFWVENVTLFASRSWLYRSRIEPSRVHILWYGVMQSGARVACTIRRVRAPTRMCDDATVRWW